VFINTTKYIKYKTNVYISQKKWNSQFASLVGIYINFTRIWNGKKLTTFATKSLVRELGTSILLSYSLVTTSEVVIIANIGVISIAKVPLVHFPKYNFCIMCGIWVILKNVIYLYCKITHFTNFFTVKGYMSLNEFL
jgi:hypothetical protein